MRNSQHFITASICSLIILSCSFEDFAISTSISEEDLTQILIDWQSRVDTLYDAQTQTSYYLLNPYKNRGALSLKGGMHIHTSNSAAVDGYPSGTPEWTAIKYRDEGGFDFYTITDHNYNTPDPKVDGIIWMGNAIEDTKIESSGHHLVIYNIPEDYEFQFISDDINEQIDYYHSIGALVSYAHPDWGSQYQSDDKVLSVRNADFVEVLNNHDGSIRAYNVLSTHYRIGAFATDDFHFNTSKPNPGKSFNTGFLIVYAHKKTKKSIWRAIIDGCYYASSGAKIDITCVNGIIKITSEIPTNFEIRAINPHDIRGNQVVYSKDKTSLFEYEINPTYPVFWIMATNEQGTAVSQTFYIKSS